MDDQKLINIIAEKTGLNASVWKLRKDTIICSVPYKCFVCKSMHSSDNLHVFTK